MQHKHIEYKILLLTLHILDHQFVLNQRNIRTAQPIDHFVILAIQ